MTVPEAELRRTEEGLLPAGEGWYVLNLADAPLLRLEGAGAYAPLETPENRFGEFGINVHIVGPGEPNALYHGESTQEAFLVLHGECLLIVEEQERRLRAWDFFHCPPGTRHVFVGAGDGPCAILMVGARTDGSTVIYPVSEVAGRYDASAAEETGSSKEAYRGRPHETVPEANRWPLG